MPVRKPPRLQTHSENGPLPDSVPHYDPQDYTYQPYEAYDGEDVRPGNVDFHGGMQLDKPLTSNPSQSHSLPSPTPGATNHRTRVPDIVVYYGLLLLLIILIRSAQRRQRPQSEKQQHEAALLTVTVERTGIEKV